MTEEKKTGILKSIYRWGKILGFGVLCFIIGSFFIMVAYGIKTQCKDIPIATGIFVECSE